MVKIKQSIVLLAIIVAAPALGYDIVQLPSEKNEPPLPKNITSSDQTWDLTYLDFENPPRPIEESIPIPTNYAIPPVDFNLILTKIAGITPVFDENLLEMEELTHSLLYTNVCSTSVYVGNNINNRIEFVAVLDPSITLPPPAPRYVIFIIDESKSLGKTGFDILKDGIKKSIKYIRDCDSYLIIPSYSLVEENEYDKFYMDRIIVSKSEDSPHKNIRRLNELIYRGGNSYYGEDGDMVTVINKAISIKNMVSGSGFDSIIILLTDGMLFTTHVSGQVPKFGVPIFIASLSECTNIEAAKAMSILNGGDFMKSKRDLSFPREFAKFVNNNSYAQQLTKVTASRDDEDDIVIFPPSFAKVFILYGMKTNKSPFDVFLQFRSGDQWITVRETITFDKSCEITKLMSLEWNMRRKIYKYDKP